MLLRSTWITSCLHAPQRSRQSQITWKLSLDWYTVEAKRTTAEVKVACNAWGMQRSEISKTITDGTQLMILLLGRRNSCVFFLYCKLNLVKRLLECDKYVKRTFLLLQVFIWNVCFKKACQKNKLVTEPWQRMFVWLQTHFSLAFSIVTYFSRSPTTSAVLFFQDGPRWQVYCIVMADKGDFFKPSYPPYLKDKGVLFKQILTSVCLFW